MSTPLCPLPPSVSVCSFLLLTGKGLGCCWHVCDLKLEQDTKMSEQVRAHVSWWVLLLCAFLCHTSGSVPELVFMRTTRALRLCAFHPLCMRVDEDAPC